MAIPDSTERKGYPKFTAYLGDGLYASYADGQITLSAGRADGEHFVVLEPETYAELTRFVETLKQPHNVEGVA